jgi:hypothetical protein
MRDRVTAPRLIPTEPPPDAAQPPLWCRALGTHPWEIVPPLLVMPGGTIRVALSCERCGSMKTQPWRRSGTLDAAGHYRYSKAYVALLEDTREAARKSVLSTTKTQPLSAYVRETMTKGARDGNSTGLRLVSSRKKRLRGRQG